MEKCEGKCHIDNSFLHEETFGANIYKLYNDAFFLKKKGQIGEFAKRKIEEIIKEICPRQLPESGAKYSEIPKVKADCLEKAGKEWKTERKTAKRLKRNFCFLKKKFTCR